MVAGLRLGVSCSAYVVFAPLLLVLVLLSGCTQESGTSPQPSTPVPTPTVTESPSESPQPTPEASPENTPSEKVYTLDEVAKHNTREDCWIVLHYKVYDVTRFIPEHPGGDAILEGCGKDATELFESRPMGSGTPHSDTAREKLSQFYIGELKVE
jgi:predicted heme/steroid binding protein